MSFTKRSLDETPEILDRVDADATIVWLSARATLDPAVVGFIPCGEYRKVAQATPAVEREGKDGNLIAAGFEPGPSVNSLVPYSRLQGREKTPAGVRACPSIRF